MKPGSEKIEWTKHSISFGESLVDQAGIYDLGAPAGLKDCIQGVDELVSNVQWQEGWITLFGKKLRQPRLIAYYGDPGTDYRYSGHTWAPRPWEGPVGRLRKLVEEKTGHGFNCCLLNYYRDGNDSMGWHSDDEPGIGQWIASLSLGYPRIFSIRPRQGGEILKIRLGDGKLLLMGPGSQANYRHSLPKTKRPVGPRINLTFRNMSRHEV